MSSDKLSKDTFEIFRDYIDSKFHEADQHFERLHECDKRIEEKIDTAARLLGEKQEKKDERKFTRQQGIFMAIVALVSSGIMWAINRVFGQ